MFWFFVGLGLVALWFLIAGDIPVQSPPSVAFLHPDLGIGGAERLVVDAGECKFSGSLFLLSSDHRHLSVPKTCLCCVVAPMDAVRI
jgi:hypothetical protein